MSLKHALVSRIASLSGPIWDRADRVTQVCHLERIVPEARSPNWPYGRLDRAPLSVPLETTLGAPRRGAKTTCERWQDRSVASDDRDPLANNPPYHKSTTPRISNNVIRRTPHHGGANPPGGRDRCISSWPRHAIPGESLGPVSRAGDPARDSRVAVVPNTLEGPGRRIGQRGDATRAPTQGPRPGRAARCRPSASRDWPQCDKSINSSPTAAISAPSPCHPPARRLLPSGAAARSRTLLARAGPPGRPAATPADPAK
jgi:hypothetical protein